MKNLNDLVLLVYDFDGVLTDNRVFVFESGLEAVRCNRADGWAIAQIKNMEISQLILSTETNAVVNTRAEKLDIPAISGSSDKESALVEYCTNHNYDLDRVLYLGNDLNDLAVMERCGVKICPADAEQEIINASDMVLKTKGGDGVIRELYRLLLNA